MEEFRAGLGLLSMKSIMTETKTYLGTRYVAAVEMIFHLATDHLTPASAVENGSDSCVGHIRISVFSLVLRGEGCLFVSVGHAVVFFSCILISDLIFMCMYVYVCIQNQNCQRTVGSMNLKRNTHELPCSARASGCRA
jgi:hypothetical protein